MITIAPYIHDNPYTSKQADVLAFFSYNESVHSDPIQGCWYDSGDYIIFAPRDALAAWYLSLAYAESTDTHTRQDLLDVLQSPLACLDQMMQSGYKQFRDQQSHGIQLSPVLHEQEFPQTAYQLGAQEGRDTALLLALTYENLGERDKASIYRQFAQEHATQTYSERCCEEGNLAFSDNRLYALERLNGVNEHEYEGLWGAQPIAIAALVEQEFAKIAGVLTYVQENFTSSGQPFDYVGGNYDIAGTIVLERLYAKKTGDQQFAPLSKHLYAYLLGYNDYGTDFTNIKPHHACTFFRACDLETALVNGVDDRKVVSPMDKPWQVTEVQTYGQAIFVLTRVLLSEYPID